MSHNPYSPPSAVVADVSEPMISLERPNHVVLGVRLLWTSFVVGLLSGLYGIFFAPTPGLSKAAQATIMVVSALIGFGISFWLNGAVWKGRNWARIVQAVLMGLGLLFVFWVTPIMFAGSVVMGIAYLVQLASNNVGVILLFTPRSNAWYRTIKNQ